MTTIKNQILFELLCTVRESMNKPKISNFTDNAHLCME